VTGTLPIANGGTGETNIGKARVALSPRFIETTLSYGGGTVYLYRFGRVVMIIMRVTSAPVTAAGATMFTLPQDYRPVRDLTNLMGFSSERGIMPFHIKTTGEVYGSYDTPAGERSGTWTFISTSYSSEIFPA
jgi:hypothetical protein